jgi:hypothetical protein
MEAVLIAVPPGQRAQATDAEGSTTKRSRRLELRPDVPPWLDGCAPGAPTTTILDRIRDVHRLAVDTTQPARLHPRPPRARVECSRARAISSQLEPRGAEPRRVAPATPKSSAPRFSVRKLRQQERRVLERLARTRGDGASRAAAARGPTGCRPKRAAALLAAITEVSGHSTTATPAPSSERTAPSHDPSSGQLRGRRMKVLDPAAPIR